jgi:hypothetical protein
MHQNQAVRPAHIPPSQHRRPLLAPSRKAKHPSYLLFDLFYWCVVFPGEKTGLFYNVNTDGKGRTKTA